MAASEHHPWFLNTSYPVQLPPHEALTKSQSEFDRFLASELRRLRLGTALSEGPATDASTGTETFTLLSETTSDDIRGKFDAMDIDFKENAEDNTQEPTNTSPFMQGLLRHGEKQEAPPIDMENKMFTENGDVAYRSTTEPLVDLFFELEEVVSGPRLQEILQAAWAVDPLSTLKIIFNARSIHLGKGSKHTFYRAAGWLAQNHPLTLVANLKWLSRPVIEKKAKKEGEDDFVIVEAETDDDDCSRFDVKHGVAHGCWKDLLNILALAVNNKLNVLANPRDVLNVENEIIKKAVQHRRARALGIDQGAVPPGGRKRIGGRSEGAQFATAETGHASEQKHVPVGNPEIVKRLARDGRHRAAVEAFNNNVVYRALHLTVARLFAEQLRSDIAALYGADAEAKKCISLCGKWAPSHDRFHDRHTFVISSIAEIMYPRESFDHVLIAADDRETYLRYAREQYRKDVSALRKHLSIVERDITANSFGNIKYDSLPSIAMQNYSGLFIRKDFPRFEKYIDRVAEGKARISGATLLPSTLVHKAQGLVGAGLTEEQFKFMTSDEMVAHKIKAVEAKVVDGLWKTLVRRIKDSGTLSSSIAVCDVSASMMYPVFKDQTCPLHAAIGLSLLVAEVTEPPFGGAFITFQARPEVKKVNLSESFTDKVREIMHAPWEGNTNFVATFEDLILPMAIENQIKQEDMVKRVFVFSDMQFDEAEHEGSEGSWSSSFERIKKRFDDAGYEMPELIFWNLAGGKAGYGTRAVWDPTAPKPVTAGEAGTALVSGYSQGMLKVFMDNGSFEDLDVDEERPNEDGEGQESTDKEVKKDPMATMKRAIGHKAYVMLAVLD